MSQMSPQTSANAGAGRTVAAGQGWAWVVGGFEMFKKQPGMWMGLMAVLVVILLVLNVLNILLFLGGIAMCILLPVFSGGLMLACQAVFRGAPLEIAHLFAGFKTQTVSLLVLGGFVILGIVAILLPAILIIGTGTIVGALSNQGAGVVVGTSFLIAWLISMGILVLVSMALMFAPALVVFRGATPVAAVQQSFFGCLRNVVPFLIYGIALLALLIVVLVIASVISLVFGLIAASVMAYLLIWLGLGPTIVGSVYLAYRDIYGDS